MPKITVTAKITAGHHPQHGAIVAGQTYEIEESDFAPELFHPIQPEPAAETAPKKGR